jgi:hypothetical protein
LVNSRFSPTGKQDLTRVGGKSMTGRFPRYAALPFVVEDDGVVAGMPVRCLSERAALVCAERMLTVFGNAGSMALRRTSASSPRLDVIKAFGDVPRASGFDDRSDSATIAR